MRIVICAKNDLAANLAVNELARHLDGYDVTLWLSDIDRPAELADPNLAILRFFERQLPKRWIWPLLDGQPGDSVACRSFTRLAGDFGYELAVVDNLKSSIWEQRLRELAPDLVISIRFSHIFPAQLLTIPTFGVINIHPGDLPSYAGLFAPFHQILDGQEHLTCTLHWIDTGIDTGPVVACRSLPVVRDRSLLWHVCRIYPLGIAPLLDVLDEIIAGRRPEGVPQSRVGRCYRRLPCADAFERFRQAGWRLVDAADFEEILENYACVRNAAEPAFQFCAAAD